MLALGPTAVPGMRATDAHRETAIRLLKRGISDGALSLDTFEQRVAVACCAQSVDHLWWLVGDLAERSPHAFSEASLADELPAPTPPREVVLPALGGSESWIIGRSRSCNLQLSDSSVSRVHALLTLESGAYVLRDLKSTNGTSVNCWLIETATLRDGDEVAFGAVAVRFVRREPPV